jgi:hypothetical protein
MSKWNFVGPFLLTLAILASPASAQYMYLDANGDGVNTAADSLNSGSSTTLRVYLNTNHDRDGSLQTCNSHTVASCDASGSGSQLNLFSFQVYLSASGGTVNWGTFTPDTTAFAALVPQISNSTDVQFTFSRSPGSASPAGLISLGSISVTVTSGHPSISIARFPNTPLDPNSFGTSFGTGCVGFSIGNTYVLGNPEDPCGSSALPGDWFDADGIGTEGGGMAPLAANVPAMANVQKGQPIVLVGEFSFANPPDSTPLGVEGLPPGLYAVPGEPFELKKQLRIYGALENTVPVGATFDVAWTSGQTQIARTELRSEAAAPMTAVQLAEQVRQVVTARYAHGIGHARARGLGTAALPILASMLRDDQYKPHWHKIAIAIGAIGDTSYFDTLRTFVRIRFQGTIDQETFQAVRSAQSALSAIATQSARALGYLIASTNAADWTGLPWTPGSRSREAAARLLTRSSLVALAYTDADVAADLIRDIPLPTDSVSVSGRTNHLFAQGLKQVSAKVRQRGILDAWDDLTGR